jgi:hypothetical protein
VIPDSRLVSAHAYATATGAKVSQKEAKLLKWEPVYQRPRWTTSSNGRRFGFAIGFSGRSAG